MCRFYWLKCYYLWTKL